MYFSDEIYLVSEAHEKDELKQYKPRKKEVPVWCDLDSISGTETSGGGQNGHKRSARVTVHMEDYSGEKVVRYAGETPILEAGYYDVYRTFVKGDTIELYLTQKEGVR